MGDRIWSARLDDDPDTHQYLERYRTERDIDKQEALKRILRKGIAADRRSGHPVQQAFLTVALLMILSSGVAAVIGAGIGLTTQLQFIAGGTAIGGLLAAAGYATVGQRAGRASQRDGVATDGGRTEE